MGIETTLFNSYNVTKSNKLDQKKTNIMLSQYSVQYQRENKPSPLTLSLSHLNSLNHNINSDVLLYLLDYYYPRFDQNEEDELYLLDVLGFDSLEIEFIDKTHTSYLSLCAIHLLFHWVSKGNLSKLLTALERCKKFTSPSFVSIIEVALDLAIRFKHDHIIEFLITHLDIERNKLAEELLKTAMFDYRGGRTVYKNFSFNFENEFFSHIQIKLCNNNKILVQIHSQTALQLPYLEKALSEFGGKKPWLIPLIEIKYDYSVQRCLNKIIHHFDKVCAALNSLQNENFTELRDTLTNLLLDAIMVDGLSEPNIFHYTHRMSNFIDFLLYKAVITHDKEKTILLLSMGANPNSYFDNKSISNHTLMSGVFLAAEKTRSIDLTPQESKKALANKRKRLSKLRGVFKTLLEYGCDLFEQENLFNFIMHCLDPYSNGETYFYHLHSDSTSLFEKNLYVKEFYIDIIKLSTVSEKSWKHIPIHWKFSLLGIPQTISTLNQEMQRFLSQKKYIRQLKVNPENKTISIDLSKELLTIKTCAVESLKEEEKIILAIYFAAQEKVKTGGENKLDYFLSQLEPAAGKVYIDIFTLTNKSTETTQLAGVYVYEYINSNINDKPTFIYYMKLAAAKLPHCPGLMQMLALLRGFSCTIPDYTSVSFGEAASHHGFALANILKRYPTHHIPGINIKDILKVVYKGKNSDEVIAPETTKSKYYYLKDNMSVDQPLNKSIYTNNLVTLFSLSAKTYEKIYKHPGHSLCVLFLNDEENFLRLRRNIFPDISNNDFAQLLSFYTEATQEFFANTLSMKAKL